MPKIKKIGLKAARTENKKPLEIFSFLKNVMKTKKKKPPRKNGEKKSRTFGSSKQKNAAEKQRNNSAPARKNLNSVYEKSFFKNFQKGIDFYYTMVYNKDSKQTMVHRKEVITWLMIQSTIIVR